MRALAIGIGLAAVLFLVSGGHFILTPLLLPLSLFTFWRRRRPGIYHGKAAA